MHLDAAIGKWGVRRHEFEWRDFDGAECHRGKVWQRTGDAVVASGQDDVGDADRLAHANGRCV